MTELTDAIAHLEWFTIPHTIEDCCRIARDLARDDARIRTGYRDVQRDIHRNHHPEQITADTYERIDYHDPTGDTAALNATPIAPVAAESALLARLTAMDTATTSALAMLRVDTHAASVTPDGRLKALTADLRYIQTIGAPAPLSAEQALWQAFTREILTDAEWLHRKGEGLWAQAKPGQREPAIQKQRMRCISCERFNGPSGRIRDVDVDPRYRDCCSLCGQYRESHRHLPDEPIIRGWDYGKQPGMTDHLRAKAASTTRRKARAS